LQPTPKSGMMGITQFLLSRVDGDALPACTAAGVWIVRGQAVLEFQQLLILRIRTQGLVEIYLATADSEL
jgi:hypothetical protein